MKEKKMDEFSFPTIVTEHELIPDLPFPSLAATSLWFHSPEADSSQLRRSFSEGGAHIATTCRRALRPSSPAVLSDYGCSGEEERMDMLWEDFNEEFYRAGDPRGAAGRRSMGMDVLAGEGGLLAKKELRLEVSKSRPLRRKPAIVVMLRMLKKMFIAQKTHSDGRKPKQQK
ncbi:uncharacterized protein LOC103974339 [Musa acuminata AAA Group]|uniref:uncharacterized protein LOC103974339 n=1 Tax=Musa acuminata AAA Group TaxID=214697 RepID=UPI0031DDA86D